MRSSLSQARLSRYTAQQLNTFFPDENPVESSDLAPVLTQVFEKLSRCFSGLGIPYFWKDGEPYFNHLHSEQYAMYLYVLGNTVFQQGMDVQCIAVKSYLLNKALHGLEVFYEIQLPEVFWFAHAIGSVLGRASYGNRIAVMQGCTIGNKGGVYPIFGERVVLCAGSTVLGGVIGSDVCIGAGSLLVNETVPDSCTVVGSSPHVRILRKRSALLDTYFPQNFGG
jgi:serine O-acetyltransferase